MTFQNQNAVCRVLTRCLALAFSCGCVLNHTGLEFLFMALASYFCSCSTLFAAASYSPFIFWQLIMRGWELLFCKWNEAAAAGRTGNYNNLPWRGKHWWGLWKKWRSLFSLRCALLQRQQREWQWAGWVMCLVELTGWMLLCPPLQDASSWQLFFFVSSLMLPWYVKEFAQLWFCSYSRKNTWEAGIPVLNSRADFSSSLVSFPELYSFLV